MYGCNISTSMTYVLLSVFKLPLLRHCVVCRGAIYSPKNMVCTTAIFVYLEQTPRPHSAVHSQLMLILSERFNCYSWVTHICFTSCSNVTSIIVVGLGEPVSRFVEEVLYKFSNWNEKRIISEGKNSRSLIVLHDNRVTSWMIIFIGVGKHWICQPPVSELN